MEKVSAWDFEEVLDAVNGDENFDLCYTDSTCIEVGGWMGPSVLIGACLIEIMFWWMVLWGGKRMLKNHWRVRLDNGRRRLNSRHPDKGGERK